MIDYLIEREREENFRTSTRTLKFPDGVTRRIEAYRIIWAWFDRAVAFEFGPTKDEILKTAFQCSEEENLPLEQAISLILDYMVKRWENSGLDFTDHNLPLNLAQVAIEKFRRK